MGGREPEGSLFVLSFISVFLQAPGGLHSQEALHMGMAMWLEAQETQPGTLPCWGKCHRQAGLTSLYSFHASNLLPLPQTQSPMFVSLPHRKKDQTAEFWPQGSGETSRKSLSLTGGGCDFYPQVSVTIL